MARASDILILAKWALKGNSDNIRSACKTIVSNEKQDSTLRRSLTRLLEEPLGTGVILSEQLPHEIKNLVLHIAPKLQLHDVIIPSSVSDDLLQFIKEREHIDALKNAGFNAPHRILLSGLPGNGKTALAGAIATTLELPFFVLDYQKVIKSHLGETGENVATVFRSLNEIPCVLFIDEMETVLTERNRSGQDVGEMARVVSYLLLEIDRLSDNVVLIGATNHPEMLDRAVVRRFEYHWELPPPEIKSIESWLERFSKRYPAVPLLENKAELLSDKDGWSYSDIENNIFAWCRKWVVENS